MPCGGLHSTGVFVTYTGGTAVLGPGHLNTSWRVVINTVTGALASQLFVPAGNKGVMAAQADDAGVAETHGRDEFRHGTGGRHVAVAAGSG